MVRAFKNVMRMSLCLGDVSLIKLGMSEEEYVHLSSEVRIFFFLCLVIYFYPVSSLHCNYRSKSDLFSAVGAYSKRYPKIIIHNWRIVGSRFLARDC